MLTTCTVLPFCFSMRSLKLVPGLIYPCFSGMTSFPCDCCHTVFSFNILRVTQLFSNVFLFSCPLACTSSASKLAAIARVTPPTSCVCLWFCWCMLGAAAGLLMRMYCPQCRPPSGCPAAENAYYFNQFFSLSLCFSLLPSATPQLNVSLFFFCSKLSVRSFLY